MISLKKKKEKVLLSLFWLALIALFYSNATIVAQKTSLTRGSEFPLINIFRSFTTSVVNSNNKLLPKTHADFPLTASGVVDYSNGGAFPAGASGLYESGQSFSQAALLVLPPASSSDFIKINFTKPSQIELNRSSIWYLSGTYGIQKALPNVSQGVRVQIVVAGDPIDSTDSGYAVVDEFIVNKTNITLRTSNFGTWPLRNNFYFVIQVSVIGAGNTNENLIIDNFSVKSLNQRPSMGIAQSNLLWEQNSSAIISKISDAGSRWIRTNLSTSSNASAFSNAVLASNKENMKVLAVVMPEYYEDFADPLNSLGNADSASDGPFKKKCGFSMGAPKVSKIDIGLFSSRLENNLRYLKSVGAKVDAFEIGNELDWVCFNGDIQLGTTPIATSLPQQFYVKYGEMLKQSKRLVEMYFPESKVLSFGAANAGLFGAPDSYVQDPQNMLASLTYLSGVNYLQYADAVGIHLYPASSSVTDILGAKKTISNYSSVSDANKPIWITEWGFSFSSQISSAARYTALRSFVDLVNSMPEVTISNIFLFTFYLPGDGFSFVDGSGNVESSIRIMKQYNGLLGR